MDKQSDDLAVALHEIAARRDARLQERAIKPARLESLRQVVDLEFPLERALAETGRRRDFGLTPRVRTPPHTPDWSPRHFARLVAQSAEALRSWDAVGVAAAILLLAGFLVLENRPAADKEARNPLLASPGLASAQTPQPRLRADRFLAGEGSRLALRVSSHELAQLRPSLLSASRVFSPDFSGGKLNLRLDLPISQILADARRVEIP